jgi:hypothetical protein
VLRSNALADGKKLNKSSGSVRDKKTVGAGKTEKPCN